MKTLRFDVLGIPVNVQPAFALLLGVYLLFQLQARQPLWSIASFAVVVFGSILLHELGHAVVARRLKVRVGEIHIHGFGGHVTLGPSPPAKQLGISLAGPGAGLLLGLPLWLLWPGVEPVTDEIVGQLVFVNVGWSIFNLLPMAPLDGGHALQSLLLLTLPARRALYATAVIGLLCGAGIAILGWQANMIFLMFIGGFAAWSNVQTMQRLQHA